MKRWRIIYLSSGKERRLPGNWPSQREAWTAAMAAKACRGVDVLRVEPDESEEEARARADAEAADLRARWNRWHRLRPFLWPAERRIQGSSITAFTVCLFGLLPLATWSQQEGWEPFVGSIGGAGGFR